MTPKQLPSELREQIIAQAKTGQAPESVLKTLVASGWQEQEATDAIEAVLLEYLTEHARTHALPPPTRVPSPITQNGPASIRAGDRDVRILASLMLPRVVVFGSLLSDAECDELVDLARKRVKRSSVLNMETGGDDIHDARTSEGTYFARGANPLCARIEARIAALLDWPVDNGEGLQILHYGAGAEYKPHYDYFDPQHPGTKSVLKRGGQRVASVVMYLNTPRRGGATIFPDAMFEVGAVKGNAVFFSYDRPHPMTRSLHGGAPVIEGDKWVATKWLREGPHI
jgi:prolyl 4-hydroxylase